MGLNVCLYGSVVEISQEMLLYGEIKGKAEKIPIQSGKQYNANVYIREQCQTNYVFEQGCDIKVDSDYVPLPFEIALHRDSATTPSHIHPHIL